MSASSHAIEREDMDIPLANSIRKLIHNLPPILYLSSSSKTWQNERKRATHLRWFLLALFMHHGKKELQEHKLSFLREFINRGNVNLEKIIRVIKEWEERIRRGNN